MFSGDGSHANLLNKAAAAMPIAGVMQMAMDISDVGLLDVDLETSDSFEAESTRNLEYLPCLGQSKTGFLRGILLGLRYGRILR